MGKNLLPTIEDYLGRRARIYGGERVVVVDVVLPAWRTEEPERLAELRALAHTAGILVLGEVLQYRDRPDPATFLGKGKAEEARQLAQEVGADTLLVGAELTPAQARNLEELTGLKVVDRSQLILDIFAQRAGTPEAALAVELAQLEYLLPRLRGWGTALSNPGGGIGTMGPGETKLEQSRRAIRRRIQVIRRELKKAEQDRAIRRWRRQKAGLPLIALVGYTNSGKSSLFARLAKTETFVEDKLFATLDTRTRRMFLPTGAWALLTDTVGFIRDLPHELIPAFRATLESVAEARLLLLVVDAASPSAGQHLHVARQVIAQNWPRSEAPPILHVFNKIDLLNTAEAWTAAENLAREFTPAVFVSAKTGENIDALKEAIASFLVSEPVS